MSRHFTSAFQAELLELMKWRRDVRHFNSDAVDPGLLEACLQAFALAPSVGLSEPWRIVSLTSPAAKAAALANFETANAQALAGYQGDEANTYAKLKLSGMREAPVQLAVFCDEVSPKGKGLGAASMPEMRRYSVVSAVMMFWLAARAYGLGVGWVSILDPARLQQDLDVPKDWRLVALLCVGHASEDTLTPELEDAGWEARDASLVDLIER